MELTSPALKAPRSRLRTGNRRDWVGPRLAEATSIAVDLGSPAASLRGILHKRFRAGGQHWGPDLHIRRRRPIRSRANFCKSGRGGCLLRRVLVRAPPTSIMTLGFDSLGSGMIRRCQRIRLAAGKGMDRSPLSLPDRPAKWATARGFPDQSIAGYRDGLSCVARAQADDLAREYPEGGSTLLARKRRTFAIASA